MFYKKKGMPEDDELVICTVKKILYHSVFVILDEYQGLEGMIHISEIAPGRIRNIRDYVKEGKQIICKILKIYRDKGHFDLSLRRVSTGAMKRKSQEYKQEQKAEKILEIVGKGMKKDLKELYAKVGDKIIEEYEGLMPCFQDIVKDGDAVLKELNIPPEYIGPLVKAVQERIKPPEVKFHLMVELKSDAPDGIDKIKKVLKEGKKFIQTQKYDSNIAYISSPKYKISMKTDNPKEAAENAYKVAEFIVKAIEKEGGEGSFSKK